MPITPYTHTHTHTPAHTVKEEVFTVWRRDYAGYVEQILLNASDPYTQGVWA